MHNIYHQCNTGNISWVKLFCFCSVLCIKKYHLAYHNWKGTRLGYGAKPNLIYHALALLREPEDGKE